MYMYMYYVQGWWCGNGVCIIHVRNNLYTLGPFDSFKHLLTESWHNPHVPLLTHYAAAATRMIKTHTRTHTHNVTTTH